MQKIEEKQTPTQADSQLQSKKHDDFFRACCSKNFIVEPLLRHFIDPNLSSKFDYGSLELCNDNYITPELANYYSDRLWSIRFNNSHTIFQLLLLFEHKSFIPKRIHIQLLRYMIEEWTKQIENQLTQLRELKKKNEKSRGKIKLILVLPIVLYHGKQAWKKPEFEDLFGKLPDVLKEFLPDFDFIVIDLSKYSDQEILDTKAGLLVNMLLLMRHSFDPDFLVKNFDLLMTGTEDYDRDSDNWNFVKMLFAYLLKLLKNSPMEKAAVIQKIQTKRVKRDFYSIYDALRDDAITEGKQEGIQLGKLEGKLEGMQEGEVKKARLVVLRGKWKGASADYLADLSELPFTEVENIIKGYDVVYKSWINKKVIKSTAHLSKEEVNYLIDLFNKTNK